MIYVISDSNFLYGGGQGGIFSLSLWMCVENGYNLNKMNLLFY